MMLIISAIITIPLLLFARSILVRMGAGRVVPLATSYAQIIFIGTTLIFWAHVANALLRAEGDVRRAMYAGMGGALLNIVLDPIFIYTLRLGVPGAAWASVISMLVSSSLLFYWVCIKRDTYISLTLRYFRFKKQIIRDILRVGLPASIMQIALAISVLFLNMIAVRAGGTDGVAVYTTAWRVRLLGVLPLFGIATAVTSVTGAAFGAHEYDKLDTAYMYAVKIGVIIELIAALVTYILAVQITSLFTIAQEATRIAGDIVISIRIICIYYPAAALGIFSSAMFQGIGKGTHSLIVTVFRTVILLTPLAYLFAITFRMQLPGIWWGMVVGNTVGATLAFIWARYTINRLKNKDRIAPSES
jgi:putative MATE family efflux protein